MIRSLRAHREAKTIKKNEESRSSRLAKRLLRNTGKKIRVPGGTGSQRRQPGYPRDRRRDEPCTREKKSRGRKKLRGSHPRKAANGEGFESGGYGVGTMTSSRQRGERNREGGFITQAGNEPPAGWALSKPQ